MPTFLDTILAHKRLELERDSSRLPLKELQARLIDLPPTRSLADALRRRKNIHLIAEIKKASPSKGVLREDFDPVAIAYAYDTAGADALSVLTDERFFQGSLDHLRAVRAHVDRPILRKDFTLDVYHLYQARVAGADAVLLIVALLSDDALHQLSETARTLGLDVLVEVHNESEIERALRINPSLIGVNNRDLRTFNTTLETTFRLRSQIPEGVLCVSESGIESREDVKRLESARVDAILVGEALMRSPDILGKIRELFGEHLTKN